MIGGPSVLALLPVLGFIFLVIVIFLSVYGARQSWVGLKFKISGMKQLLVGFVLIAVSQVLSVIALSTPISWRYSTDMIALLLLNTITALPLIIFGFAMIFLSLGLLNMIEDAYNIEYVYNSITKEKLRRKKGNLDKMLEGG